MRRIQRLHPGKREARICDSIETSRYSIAGDGEADGDWTLGRGWDDSVAGEYESDLFARKDLGTIGPIRTHRRTRLGILAGFVKSLVLWET
jgi:hypothetical protein